MAPRYLSGAALCALVSLGLPGGADPGYGTYAWPVVGPVIRGFDPPPDPYGPGHRGIDIGAPFGSPLVAAEEGVVAFAGWVGGSLFISIDHPDGVRSTYSWLSAVGVSEGQQVLRSEGIGRTGRGHDEVPSPHLHFGTRIDDTYIDPLLMLERGSVVGLIHLAPILPPEPDRRDGWRRNDVSPWARFWITRPLGPDGPTYNERSWTPTENLRASARGPPAPAGSVPSPQATVVSPPG